MDQINPVTIQEPIAFDYQEMDAATADEAQAIVYRFRSRQRTYIMDTGRDLIAMKERLEHGLFTKWVEGALGMTARSAQNYMQAASVLGDKSETVSLLPPTTLYKLAAPSTPAPLRDEIVRRLEAGEALTSKAIEGQLWTARAEAKRAQIDAKLAPEERKRRAKAKRTSEAKRLRDHEKWRTEQDERTAAREAANKELAEILVRFLDQDAYRRVYDLIPGINTYDLRTALAEARSAGEIADPASTVGPTDG